MSRIQNSKRNIIYSVIGQIFGILISFFARNIFIRILGKEYLGLDGLFSNILKVLSVAELGVGAAIVFSMYKPLAEKNYAKVNALMALYKKAYTIIGIVVGASGLALLPALDYLIKDKPDIPNFKLIYLLFVMNSSISYFFSYKRSLIIADQKRYITAIFRYVFFFVLNVTQIIVLLLTRNYILFLILQVINTLAENVFISIKADKMYPFLNEDIIDPLNDDEKTRIRRDIKALMYHKIGGSLVTGTDNLIISKFVGIISVGLYSNYLLITNAINTILTVVFESLTASVGNLGATASKQKQFVTFETTNFAGFWLYSFCSICLMVLLNPFIELWVGRDYLLTSDTVLLIVFVFYLNGMRRSVLVFKNALGLYWEDRYKPIIQVIVNIVTSIILAIIMGINGVFIGTIISIFSTCFWVEPYVLYKHGFNKRIKHYMSKYLIYTVVMMVAGMITYYVGRVFSKASIIHFIGRAILCLVLPNLIYVLAFSRTREYNDLLRIVKQAVFNGSKLS